MYKSGQWNAICDVCGVKFPSGEMRKRWDGLMVCVDDFEHDHPQKYLRVRTDKIVPPWVRPEPEDSYRYVCYRHASQSYADLGEADCMRADTQEFTYSEAAVLATGVTPTPAPAPAPAAPRSGDLFRVLESSFVDQAPVEDFEALSGSNPSLVFSGSLTATTSHFFMGQATAAPAPYVLTGAPTNPLTLNIDDWLLTSVTTDSAREVGQQKTLTGTPLYLGPIAVLFNEDVLGVAFDVGYLNATETVTVTLYDRAGTSLGVWTSSPTNPSIYSTTWSNNFEVFAIVRDSLTANIAGFTVETSDNPGVAIDNLRVTVTPY